MRRGPRAMAYKRHHADSKCSKASSARAKRRSPPSSPAPLAAEPAAMTFLATSSLLCQSSMLDEASRICCSTLLGHPNLSSSASCSRDRAWMFSAMSKICRSSAGWICGRASASSTLLLSASASGAASSSFFCSTAPRAQGKGPSGSDLCGGPACRPPPFGLPCGGPLSGGPPCGCCGEGRCCGGCGAAAEEALSGCSSLAWLVLW
mmetsp:Transcript_121664/g.306025  ORF Transcript_121664/g.306025 Transcript_121664/m.306025 type:complete len:206 (+) Transcript_121664:1316-1933(+)